MRMSSIGFLLAGVLLAGAAAPVRAQSLAEGAKKEEDRRRHTKTGKVYTNSDLSAVPGASSPPAVDAAPAVPAAPAADATTTDRNNSQEAANAKADERGQAYWTKRMADLRE